MQKAVDFCGRECYYKQAVADVTALTGKIKMQNAWHAGL
mgnify:CR=1 FL=1